MRITRLSSLFAIAAVTVSGALVGAGCSTSPSAIGGTHLSTTRSPIINGQKDTTHEQVVDLSFIVDPQKGLGGGCTGTVIQEDTTKNRSYVLTAAHCTFDSEGSGAAFDPTYYAVLVGDTTNPEGAYNFQTGAIKANGKTVFQVTRLEHHPSYDGNKYDFGMLEVEGLIPVTVIPPLTKALDDIKEGSQVDVIGYGILDGNDPNAENNTRYHFASTVSFSLGKYGVGIDQTTQLGFDQKKAGGGACEGDSGGPALYVASDGNTYVAGTTSFGDQTCVTFGVDSRVTSGLDFISNFIAGQATGGDDSSGDDSSAGGCGFDVSSLGGSCQGCFDASCCNEGNACAGDDTCTGCATGQITNQATCSGNAAFTALAQCLGGTCANDCGGGGTGDDTSGDDGGGGQCQFQDDPSNPAPAGCLDCLDANCCDSGAACQNDATCSACLDNPQQSCLQNPAFAAFYQCNTVTCAVCAGGDPGDDSSGDDTSTGTGGSPSTGTGGKSSGTGGKSSGGTGGKSSGTGGSTGIGIGNGTGGSSNATGGSGSVGTGNNGTGGSGPKSTTGGTGATGTNDTAQEADDQPASSGGCAVADDGGANAFGALGVALAFLAAKRRKNRVAG